MRMLGFMNCQCSSLAETFTANVALEGFVFAVDVLVITKMVLATESFTTNITREGPLIGVGTFVDEKVVTFGELSIAVLADVPFLGAGEARFGYL